MYVEEEMHFASPRLRTVPVSYLITMTNSPRRASYLAQLRAAAPTRRVVILHNPGRSEKPGVHTPAQDLWHANQHIACRAVADGHPFVLILEDDVQFTDEFVRHAPRLDAFLDAHDSERALVYSLGLQAHLCLPTRDPHHLRVGVGGFAQAVVYNRAALDGFAALHLPRWGVHDLFVFARFRCYCPRRACAVQPYECTANARRWDVLRVCHAMHAACGNDPQRLFALYDAFNAWGGTVPAAAVLMVVAAAMSRSTIIFPG